MKPLRNIHASRSIADSIIFYTTPFSVAAPFVVSSCISKKFSIQKRSYLGQFCFNIFDVKVKENLSVETFIRSGFTANYIKINRDFNTVDVLL